MPFCSMILLRTLSAGHAWLSKRPRRGAVVGPGGVRQGARQAIDQRADLGDRDTAHLFTEVSRGIHKRLWFVEAHLEAER
jgi:hypothetical protein